ncbi:potassium channel family protein [Fodinibius salsisoli]|uniref:Potassium channel protein n=1 Tax=Fodinibius salsisoli TaxID=2820877 RepID=A0ABT3PMD6_9BACT|nr:NAD-binding protein [Fodinibius salsisoli]MCW9706933.1 potassium channel protein [Fodinibius salsisoli]
MKFFTSQLSFFLSNRNTRVNIKRLVRFLSGLLLLILIYTILFHFIMLYEGQSHSWITGFYWTLTVMTTLGFGDITFTSDIGRAFSVIVLLSGMVSLLILLPFTFIEFFYAPWLDAQSKARAPRELPEDTSNHIIITHFNPISESLIEKLRQYNYEYVLLFNDLPQALKYYDQGYRVVFGELDDPETYKKLQVDQAAMVAALGSDMVNSNISNTVRELDEEVTIVTTANSVSSVDLLEMAGSNHVIQLGKMLGNSLSRRISGQDSRVHVVGRFDNLIVAEATAYKTPLVGKTLRESKLRDEFGINIVGVWERGKLLKPEPDTLIHEQSVLLMAGSLEQLRIYDEFMAIYHATDKPVIIIGAGRVGRGVAEAFEKRDMDYYIVDKNPDRIKDDNRYILGNAEDIDVLEKAGIKDAPCIIITTHDDDMNIYLTIYARRLRPNIQIISRSTVQRNVSTLHRAGADFVMSYATMGANVIFNILERSDVVMIAEGLNVFNIQTPDSLVGKSLISSSIRLETGCSVLGIKQNGQQHINPKPEIIIQKGSELVLIGNAEAERLFMERFMNGKS